MGWEPKNILRYRVSRVWGKVFRFGKKSNVRGVCFKKDVGLKSGVGNRENFPQHTMRMTIPEAGPLMQNMFCGSGCTHRAQENIFRK